MGVVLGQIKCAEKSNEITAIPELLNLLKLKSSIITIDAMGCQKEIAKEITKKKCDYVLALKENQPAAYNDVKDYFSIEDKDFQNTLLRFETLDIGHGREERREYFLSTENIAILRRICFNRMKMYQNGKTLKRKKMLCTFDDSFRFNILFSEIIHA